MDAPSLALDLSGDVGGPTIVIQAPAAMAEVQYDTLTVTAKITSATSRIDGATVALIIPAATNSGTASAPMALTAMPDTYQGQIDISALPSGPSQVVVTAADIMGRKSNAEQDYIHDHGPVITFVQPSAPTAKGSANVEIIVDDSLHPVTDPSSVTVKVGLSTVSMSQVQGAVPLRLTGLIDFSTFHPELDGQQLITATATNPKGTIGRETHTFTVDNAGPTITPMNPTPGQFVGGILDIDCTISDLSGVDDSTVIAVLGGNSAQTTTLTHIPGGNEYTGIFDLKSLGTTYVFPAFSIRAKDKLGNQIELGIEIIVDNTPPILSFDPPDVRTFVPDSKWGNQCSSHAFDPVGADSVNDGALVQQVFTLRLRAQDMPNQALGQTVTFPSLLDHNSVRIYAAPVGTPLAVRTLLSGGSSATSYCDGFNPHIAPTSIITGSNQAFSLQMGPITPANTFDYSSLHEVPTNSHLFGSLCGSGYTCDSAAAAWGTAGCDVIGSGDPTSAPGDPPQALCSAVPASMTGALSYVLGAPEPQIWTIPPTTNSPLGCAGIQFDAANIGEGPICIVAVATDKVGNTNVSAPLRLCVDGPHHLCTSWPPGTLPDCTGTYDKPTDVVTSTACTPQTFANYEIIHQ